MMNYMEKQPIQINNEYFTSLSREALRILRHMAEKWPEKRPFYTDELGDIVGLKGKELGGVLGTFSKKAGEPLVVKIGTISVGWQGQEFSRPKQVWALNPRLEDGDIKKIRNILAHFLLDIHVERVDELETDQYFYRLTYFSGDNTYVITKLKKSSTIVRGETIFKNNNKKEAIEKFNQIKKKGGE